MIALNSWYVRFWRPPLWLRGSTKAVRRKRSGTGFIAGYYAQRLSNTTRCWRGFVRRDGLVCRYMVLTERFRRWPLQAYIMLSWSGKEVADLLCRALVALLRWLYVFGSLISSIVCDPSLGQEIHLRKCEVRQSATLYRRGSLASVENARPSIGFQGQTVLWDIWSLKVMVERKASLLAALALALRTVVRPLMTRLLYRPLVDLKLIFIWPSLMSGSPLILIFRTSSHCSHAGYR
jgi:hypothetical protein